MVELGQRLRLYAACVAVALGAQACEAAPDEPDAAADAAWPQTDASGTATDASASAPPPYRPDLITNRWERVRDDLPSPTWETGIAYDPRVGALVQHGGHLPSSYVQSSYSWRYDVRGDAYEEVLALTRPMRRCIVELAWLSGAERVATVQGAATHGSLPQGTLRGWRVTRSDARGPWLYDALADSWEHTRPLGTEWPQRAHAAVAYDETSDAMYVVGRDALYAYVAHANQILRLPMPSALHGRRGYGMAFDPDSRRLVIFGGATRHWTYGHIDGDETDNCNVVDAETCASYYRAYVRSDTWVLDVDEAASAGWPDADGESVPVGWHEVVTGTHPPRGMPMWHHARLQLTWHPPSGRMLLAQNPIDDAPNRDPATWPPVQMWAFDAASQEWSEFASQEAPHFAGLAAYATHEDVLFAWGGGERGVDASRDSWATSSRVLYMMRPAVPGADMTPPAALTRVRARATDAAHVEVSFEGQTGQTYEIERAATGPMVDAYSPIGTVTAGGARVRFEDTIADARIYAYRVRPVSGSRFSLPAFAVPTRPSGLFAIVRGPTQVELRWSAPGADVSEVRIYRFGPSESRHQIASVPGDATTYSDLDIDLSDGRSRVYVTTFVDAAGHESGFAPMAYTAPDPPAGLIATDVGGGEFEIRWTPRHAMERLEVFYLDYHCNARTSIESFLDAFTPVPGGPFEGGFARVRAPALDPAVRNRAPELEPGECRRTQVYGHYFYARVVDAIGTRGLYSDIVSPEDPRFRAAQPTGH